MNVSTKRTSVPFPRKFLRWILQFLVGGILLASALGKSLDMPGFIEVLKTYEAFSSSLLKPLAITVTGVEFLLGVWVLSGYQLSWSALMGALLNTIYALWVSITLLRGLTLRNCGCFGVFFPQPLTWLTPVEDVIFVGFCVVLAYLSQTEKSPHRGFRPAVLN